MSEKLKISQFLGDYPFNKENSPVQEISFVRVWKVICEDIDPSYFVEEKGSVIKRLHLTAERGGTISVTEETAIRLVIKEFNGAAGDEAYFSTNGDNGGEQITIQSLTSVVINATQFLREKLDEVDLRNLLVSLV